MGWLTNRYNKKTSKKYGWEPAWFDAEKFDSFLEQKVKDFQNLHEDLEADGKVGIKTYRRILLARKIDLPEDNTVFHNHALLVNGEFKKIDWPKIKVHLLDKKCFRKSKRLRKPSLIVTHWDVCKSANACRKVLAKRNISTHFVIDNDGTIVQLVDTNDIAWHARGSNNNSIGIDISSAYYLKYADYYEKKGFGKRPTVSNSRVHGVKLKPHLGYYPLQVKAYKKLIEFLTKEYPIPLEYPKQKDGSQVRGVHKPASQGKFKGVVHHYHLTRNKIDTSGFPLEEIVDKIKIKGSED